MSVLFRIRKGEKEAVEKELESWQATRGAEAAGEIEELLEEVLAERDSDEALFKRILQRARGADQQKIDEAYRFIHEYCERSMRIHDLLRTMIAQTRRAGRQVSKAEALDRVTGDYKAWQEDYPELLLMAYEPVAQVIQDRTARALASKPTESNWRQLFAGEEDSPTDEAP
jgi:hypothetical protein